MPFFFELAVPDKLKYMSQFSKSMRTKKRKPLLNSLRKHRKARGLKQKEVANILGLKSASMVSRWENGHCMPKLQNIFKLAILYRTMADGLFIDLRRLLKEEILKAEEELLQKQDG